MTDALENCKKKIAKFINIKKNNEIIFSSGATKLN
ncbi:MAG: aminotransferase class V-fold PLP-dependent enzyme [Candidatus Helarchaeota archaeon]